MPLMRTNIKSQIKHNNLARNLISSGKLPLKGTLAHHRHRFRPAPTSTCFTRRRLVLQATETELRGLEKEHARRESMGHPLKVQTAHCVEKLKLAIEHYERYMVVSSGVEVLSGDGQARQKNTLQESVSDILETATVLVHKPPSEPERTERLEHDDRPEPTKADRQHSRQHSRHWKKWTQLCGKAVTATTDGCISNTNSYLSSSSVCLISDVTSREDDLRLTTDASFEFEVRSQYNSDNSPIRPCFPALPQLASIVLKEQLYERGYLKRPSTHGGRPMIGTWARRRLSTRTQKSRSDVNTPSTTRSPDWEHYSKVLGKRRGTTIAQELKANLPESDASEPSSSHSRRIEHKASAQTLYYSCNSTMSSPTQSMSASPGQTSGSSATEMEGFSYATAFTTPSHSPTTLKSSNEDADNTETPSPDSTCDTSTPSLESLGSFVSSPSTVRGVVSLVSARNDGGRKLVRGLRRIRI